MNLLAVVIMISTVLLLVDRNKAWSGFWRFSKRAGVAALVLVLLLGGYLYWNEHRAAAHETFYNVHPIPAAK